MFVRTNDSLYVSINHYPQHVLCFYIISGLCVMHLFSAWRSKIFFRKSCVDFNFISLIHSYIYIHISLSYQELYLQDSWNNLARSHSYIENYHQLFKHWLLNLSKISWLHVLKRLIFPSNILKNILKYILYYLSVTMSYWAWYNSWLIMSYVLK